VTPDLTRRTVESANFAPPQGPPRMGIGRSRRLPVWPAPRETPMVERAFSGTAIRHAAHIARLDITGREELLGPVMEGIYALIDQLDAVPLGETPPAVGFDPRQKA
jgi:hypothetical protein